MTPTPYYTDDLVTLYHGDCREILPLLADESFGAIITDPPYGVGVADWDRDVDWTWASHADRLLVDPGHLFCFWSVSGLRDFADIPGLKYERVTPRLVARDLGLPLLLPRRKRRATNSAPSWDQVLDWAVEAYWERQGTTHGRAA